MRTTLPLGAGLACLAALACVTFAATASAQGIGPHRIGQIDITATSSEFSQGSIVYKGVHLQAQDGTTLSADKLSAGLNRTGTGVQSVVLSGHVTAYVQQIEQGRTVTITTDRAVYDPKAGRIDMTGGVKTVATTPYTVGPLVQTGDAGYIQLGKAPDYPKIVMTGHVHTTFTPNQ